MILLFEQQAVFRATVAVDAEKPKWIPKHLIAEQINVHHCREFDAFVNVCTMSVRLLCKIIGTLLLVQYFSLSR